MLQAGSVLLLVIVAHEHTKHGSPFWCLNLDICVAMFVRTRLVREYLFRLVYVWLWIWVIMAINKLNNLLVSSTSHGGVSAYPYGVAIFALERFWFETLHDIFGCSDAEVYWTFFALPHVLSPA